MVRQIVWTSKAESQLKAVLEYYNTRNGSTKYSKKILTAVKHLQILIQHNPLVGHRTNIPFEYECRVVHLKHFNLYYSMVDTHKIIVLLFWDTRSGLNIEP